MKTSELLDYRFAMIAVKKGLISRNQFQTAMKMQRMIQGNGTNHISMSEILVKKGFVTEEAFNEVLPPALKNKISAFDSTREDNPKEPADQGSDGMVAKDNMEEDRLFIRISNDFLSAYLVCKGNAFESVSLEDIKAMAQEASIRFGLVSDDEMRRHIDSPEKAPNEWLIARGKEPQPGTPDKIDYHFDLNPYRIGTVSEDGLMDWKDRGEIPQVHEGDLLAEIIPGRKGKAGRSVLGKAIPAPEVKRAKLKVGKGVKASEDRLKFYAAKGGQPKLSADNSLSVFATLEIDGNIGIETGHVEFDGHIEVRGTIEKGYRVKGETLRAAEILSEDVEVEGDVVVSAGIFGAKIKCGGRIKANHINKSHLIAVDDVVVRKEIVDSVVDTSGKCLIDGGTILYSEIFAKMGIKSGDIGSEASNASTITVGIDTRLKNAINEFKAKVAANIEEEVALSKAAVELTEKSNQFNSELGEVAQAQDRIMVKKRGIEEQVAKEQRQPTETEAEEIAELAKEEKKYDDIVAKIMDRDEKILEERTQHEVRVEEIKAENLDLNSTIDDAVKQLKSEKGLAVIEVSGTIFQLTQLKGPHASLVLPGDYRRVVIREQKHTDDMDRKLWEFNIMPK
jgi:uncharacterized protein (DUF342 family)